MAKAKKRTLATGRKLVRQYQESGLSQAQFAKNVGMSVAVLRYWVARVRKLEKNKEQQKPVQFVELVAKQKESSGVKTIVQLPGGVTLTFQELPSPEYLVELSRAVQGRFSC